MRIPAKLPAFVSLSLLAGLSVSPTTVSAESKSGALNPAPSRPADAVVLWDRIAVDGEHAREIQARITSIDGRGLQAGGRRFAVAFAGEAVVDSHARPVSLEKALAEHPGGLCALVQYVPARLSALGADTATGVVLLVNERGGWLERCPGEETRR